MIRKWTAWIVFVMSILLLFTACSSKEPENTPITESEPVLTQTQSEEPQDTQITIESKNPNEKLSAQTVENVKDMLPVLDSIIRSMIASEGVYAPEDASFFWSTLYLTAVNFGVQLEIAEVTEDGLIMADRQAVQEIASAFFEDNRKLLNIPAELSQTVIYDQRTDAYMFSASDIGDSFSEVTGVSAQEDLLSVTVTLKSGDEEQAYLFVLTENLNWQVFAEPIFYYTVIDAKMLDE